MKMKKTKKPLKGLNQDVIDLTELGMMVSIICGVGGK